MLLIIIRGEFLSPSICSNSREMRDLVNIILCLFLASFPHGCLACLVYVSVPLTPTGLQPFSLLYLSPITVTNP